jgi:oxygen-independent coproporphyrinogen-3 oxidase
MQYSLYLHIPFCQHRCAYCDFDTYAGQGQWIPAYVVSLCAEIDYVAARIPDDLAVQSVYFGGGTPSLLSPAQLASILGTIRAGFVLDEKAEVTLEANPGMLESDRLHAFRELGINRISIGVQSANMEELRMLERQHDFLDVLTAVSAARRAGFDNLNIDLIYGFPGQTLRSWRTTVRRVLDLAPEHISAYGLSFEHGTSFGRWLARGMLAVPDPDLAADTYEWLSSELDSHRYAQYEISNWAQAGHACRHNLQYWRGLPYLGLGAGAHGCAAGYRYSNVLGIRSFIERLSPERDKISREYQTGPLPPDRSCFDFPFSPAMVDHHRQTSTDLVSEFMMTGLRLTHEGISEAEFSRRFGRELSVVYAEELRDLFRDGLLEWEQADTLSGGNPAPDHRTESGRVVRLTSRGRLLGNVAFRRFV